MDLAPSPSVRAGGHRDGVDRVEHDGVTPSSLPGCRRSSVRTVRTSASSADTEIIGTDSDKLETLFSTGVVWLVDRGNVTGIEPVMNSARLAGVSRLRRNRLRSVTRFGSRSSTGPPPYSGDDQRNAARGLPREALQVLRQRRIPTLTTRDRDGRFSLSGSRKHEPLTSPPCSLCHFVYTLLDGAAKLRQ